MLWATRGATYLILVFSTLNRLRKNGNRLRDRQSTDDERFLFCLNEACLLGLTGFVVCAMFLSLQQYEVLYFLLLLSNATLVFGTRLLGSAQPSPGRLVAPFGRVPRSARSLPREGRDHV